MRDAGEDHRRSLISDGNIRYDDTLVEELGNRESDQPGDRARTVSAMVAFFVIVPYATGREVGDGDNWLERRPALFHLYLVPVNQELGIIQAVTTRVQINQGTAELAVKAIRAQRFEEKPHTPFATNHRAQ